MKWLIIIVVCVAWPQIKDILKPLVIGTLTKTLTRTDSGIMADISLYVEDRKELKQEIHKLSMDNIYLENKVTKLEHIVHEYDIRQIESDNGNVDSVLAYSLGSKSNLIYDSFIINVGNRNGVSFGDTVYTRGRQPIGIIAEVHDNSSLVSLLSANGNELTGILDVSHDKINMTGNGGGEFIAKVKNSLLKDIDMMGTKVFYADDVSLTVGEIVRVDKEDDEDMSEVHIKGFYNPSTQTVFFIDK